MKRILLSIAILAIAACSCAASAIVDEIKRIDDIAAYHVPRFLIKNVLGMSDIIEDVVPGSQITALNDVQTLDFIMVHKSGAKKKTRKLLQKLDKDPSYQVVLRAKKGKQRETIVYGLPLNDTDYKELVVVVDEDENITIINVKGTLNVDKLSKIVPEEDMSDVL